MKTTVRVRTNRFFMSSISVLLLNVHENVHVLRMKLNYSEPKIYTGGIEIDQWPKLSKKDRKAALDKHWYVYYSFRHPETGKLVQQTRIKAGANRFKDKASRYHILKQLQLAMSIVLQEGYNPYGDNGDLKVYLKNRGKDNTETVEKPQPTIPKPIEEPTFTIGNAISLGLEIKESILGRDSFKKFKSRVLRFQKWLISNGITQKQDIKVITKKTVIQYLNHVVHETSPRNRNNTRTDLASFFQTLEDNEVIKYNYIKTINKVNAVPTRHKTFTPELFYKIDEYLIEEDRTLHLFIQFIYYGLLRPIEVCRLRIGDLNLIEKEFTVKAKNQAVKTKLILDTLSEKLPDLSKFDKNDSLFNMNEIGGSWTIDESSKRDFYTKKFKKVKDHFNLDSNYTLYSYRHTAITDLYRDLEKTLSPNEVKSKLMHITGHSSMAALESYLRSIDASLPKDFSKHMK
ncbi:tyrosine-type recombinase/integrase [Maribacter sp. X9]|uniref:tyrosine-type recombinase/integrase n=1 Tax=Maribacter sp. X9 TaxID=3402159 RepID=UPI003AF37EEB